MASRPRPVGGVLLTHGAGSDRTQTGLVAIEGALGTLPVRRMDFPYRKVRTGPPDRAPKLIESIADEAADFGRQHRFRLHRLVLGGRSMGGRMCSMAVAQGHQAAGLVMVSYPLHPPRKPEKLRVDHLPQIRVPCLFVSGTKDAFATPEELTDATATIPGSVTHHWVEGGRHELAGADAEVAHVVAEWIREL